MWRLVCWICWLWLWCGYIKECCCFLFYWGSCCYFIFYDGFWWFGRWFVVGRMDCCVRCWYWFVCVGVWFLVFFCLVVWVWVGYGWGCLFCWCCVWGRLLVVGFVFFWVSWDGWWWCGCNWICVLGVCLFLDCDSWLCVRVGLLNWVLGWCFVVFFVLFF